MSRGERKCDSAPLLAGKEWCDRSLLFDSAESQNEVFSPNSWYGSARILGNYARWSFPLPFVVPHGICLSSNYLWQAEVTSGLQEVYAFPDYRITAYQKSSLLRVVKGASPWLYLQSNKKKQRRKTISILAFPAHSTHHVAVAADDDAYAKFLVGLAASPSDVYVCMYWRDIQLGRHEAFLRRGLHVVSAGHIYDEMFFERLFHVFQHTQRVHSISIGSHLFYAASSGCHVTYAPQFEIQHTAPESVTKRDVACPDSDLLREITEVFTENMAVDEQKCFAGHILGKNNLKTRAALLRLLVQSALRCKAWQRSVFSNIKRRKAPPHNKIPAVPFHMGRDGSIILRALS